MDRAGRFFAARTLIVILTLLAGSTATFAQGQFDGALAGTVVDNVGVIPGATVTATHLDTSVTRSATTNTEGGFRITALPPGRYTVKVEMDGFRPVIVTELTLLAGELRALGRLVLTAGNITESITVTAEVTPVQTATSQMIKNLTSDTLMHVQVKGRDIFGMMKILPGVTDTTANRDYAQWRSGRGLSINGANSHNKNTTIDGVPVGEERGDGTTHITPNIDSIGEVNLITSGYMAEHGRNSSGLIAITTKSGTTQFRGSAWYNARRDEWNSNDFFRIKQNQPKPFFEVDIAGYSFGGPVVIPKLLDSRTSQRKTFFFVSQEFTDDLRPTSVTRTNLPTELERKGDFSQTMLTTSASTSSSNGIVQPIIDPTTGIAFPGNVIPQNRQHPMGKAMLHLLPLPNGILNPVAADRFSSNDARDQTPLHDRRNLVLRVDQVVNQNVRGSFRYLSDRDDGITFNRVAPGDGSVNNMFYGDLMTGSYTQVLSPSMVNETRMGWSRSHFGFRIGTGDLNPSDYTPLYQQNIVNPVTGELGLFPPRIESFGPYGTPHLNRGQTDEYPYLPNMTYSGGDRTGLAQYRPSGADGPLPRWNDNPRYTVQNDLSVTRGRHNYKVGLLLEFSSKLSPSSANYTGTYAFGHSSTNPVSTGNGYANALLGLFNTYTELSNRIDQDQRHWLTDVYAQDSWRMTPRLTLDYGLRVSHVGAVYEVNNANAAFFPDEWDPNQAPLLYRPACKTGVPGNVSCSSANRVAVDPRFPDVFLNQAFAGNVIPGTGSITNGRRTGGLPGKKPGWYYDMPFLSWAPRVGLAWDVFGDGTTAVRTSAGIFYNALDISQYQDLYVGGPPTQFNRTIRQSSIDDVTKVAQAGAGFVENPAPAGLVSQAAFPLHGRQLSQGTHHPETYYQANIAIQRDLGFNTVGEVAWVGNYGRHMWRAKETNTVPLNAYADPANLFNREPISANFLRRDWPGMAEVNYLSTDELALNYNAMQVSVQRRLSAGLQMGLAYTLSKAEGIQGWDFATEELYGEQGLRDRYYGPPSVSQAQDRRHSLVVNYSYMLPDPTPNVRVASAVLRDWEVSGVVQFLSGNAVTPSCGTNQSGVENTDPSLSGAPVTCELTGEPIFSGFTADSNLPEEDQLHFNPAAFKRPVPAGGVGNLGNAPVGVLRNPSWSNWDFTLARRFPIQVGRGAAVRLQFQMYNMWNQVAFTTMNASQTFTTSQGTGNNNANVGKYTATTNPLNMGLTLRLDY